MGRNSYTYGLILKRKNSHPSSSSFSYASTPTSNLTPIPSEVTLEAKSIIKYGYTEGKKRFESSTSLSSLQQELDEENEEDYSLRENEYVTRRNSTQKNKKSEDFIMDTETLEYEPNTYFIV